MFGKLSKATLKPHPAVHRALYLDLSDVHCGPVVFRYISHVGVRKTLEIVECCTESKAVSHEESHTADITAIKL